MNFNTKHILFICFLLSVFSLTYVAVVTDAELEALGKQIEQQEVEEKQKADAEAKRKSDLEKQQLEEAKRIAEKKRKEEEAKRLTGEEKVKQKAEGERLREEREARAQAEDEAQKKEKEKRGQFSQYMKNGDSAMNNKKYTEALRIYTQALEIFPSDSEALTGQSSAREFKDACAALVGEWDWFDALVIISADGNLQSKALISNHGSWECMDPLQRKFTLRWVWGGFVDNVTLSTDGNTLDVVNTNTQIGYQAWRKGTKEFDPSREIPL